MLYFFEYTRYILKQKIDIFDKTSIINNFIIKVLKLHIKRIILKLKRIKNLKIVAEISNLECKKTLLYKKTDRQNIIKKPNIFKNDKKLTVLKGKSPNIEIWLLNKCKVVSKTSSIIYSGYIYNNYLSNIKIFHDLKNPLSQYINSIYKKNISLYITQYLEKKDHNLYIHLLNEHSSNYYHFMFELLPKFLIINDYIKNNNEYSDLSYSLLLDEDTPSQFLEAIKYFATINYKLEFISKYNMVGYSNLIFCTDFWNSLDNTRFNSCIVDDFFVDKFAIETIKNKLNINITKPYRKIYVQRKKNQARYLSNTDELEVLLNSLDFEFILPEKLSFNEQIKIFSESKIVLGISGAVFANIVFMHENTSAIIFSPNTIAANYYVFQPMADVARINLVHILTKNDVNDSIHANSKLDLKEVTTLLEEMAKNDFS